MIAASTRGFAHISYSAACAFAGDWWEPSGQLDELMTSHARTFRFATRFMPASYRRSTLDLYAFFRTIDDLVDESDRSLMTQRQIEDQLLRWDDWFRSGMTSSAPNPLIGKRLASIVERNAIPVSLFLDFLDGMRYDLGSNFPATRSDVEHYSYQVASTVGISMAHLFGSRSSQAIEAASRLGIAMQLTNILRDIGGDLERGRIYLPDDLLTHHGLDRSQVMDMWKAGTGPDSRLKLVLNEMVAWADEHYAAGIAGVRFLPSDVRMPILIASRLYQAILRELESNDLDSLRTRVFTSNWQKVQEAYRCAALVIADDSRRHTIAHSAKAMPLPTSIESEFSQHAE